MGEVVPLPVIRIERDHGPGNGAREAVLRVFPASTLDGIDIFLSRLWFEGFKVVPVDDGEIGDLYR